MRVLIVHNAYFHSGGEEVVVALEKEMIERIGWVVEVFGVRNPESMTLRESLASAVNYSTSLLSKRLFEKALSDFRPDLVHFHNVFPQFGYGLLKVAKRYGAKVVMTLHNFRYACVNGLFLKDQKVCEICLDRPSVLRPIVRKCYRDSSINSAVVALGNQSLQMFKYFGYVDRFVVMTRFSKNILERYGISAAKVIVKPHSVDGGEKSFRFPRLAEKPIDFLYVGRVSKEKGVREFLEALEVAAPSARVVIAGDGQELRELELRFSSSVVEFCGRVDKEKVYNLMLRSKFLVFPSTWYETFGLTIVEAFANGLPVIAREIGGVSEMVDDKSGYVFSDSEDLKSVLRSALSIDEHCYLNLSAEVTRRHEYLYSHSVNQSSIRQLYTDLIRA